MKNTHWVQKTQAAEIEGPSKAMDITMAEAQDFPTSTITHDPPSRQFKQWLMHYEANPEKIAFINRFPLQAINTFFALKIKKEGPKETIDTHSWLKFEEA